MPGVLREVGAWLSLVEHCVRDAGVVGSNPIAPINSSRRMDRGNRPLFFGERIPPVERTESRTIQIVVHGDVQGVGFRWFTRQAAEHLGVCGTVANQRDGTVRIVARGRPEVLDRFQALVREGPPHSYVTHLDVHELTETFSGGGFSILH